MPCIEVGRYTWVTVSVDELVEPEAVPEWADQPQLIEDAAQLRDVLQHALQALAEAGWEGADPCAFVLRMKLWSTDDAVYVYSIPPFKYPDYGCTLRIDPADHRVSVSRNNNDAWGYVPRKVASQMRLALSFMCNVADMLQYTALLDSNVDRMDGKTWVSLRPFHLHNTDALPGWARHPQFVDHVRQLRYGLQELFEDLRERYFDGADPDDFVVRMQLYNPNAAYVHSGPFTPNARERFIVSKHESYYNAGIKPLGETTRPSSWIHYELTREQEDLMQCVFDFMRETVKKVRQTYEDGGSGADGSIIMYGR